MTQEEILNGQVGGTLQTGKAEQLFTLHETNEPELFNIVECEHGFAIVIGNKRASDWQKSKDDCQKLIDNRDWKLISTLCLAMAEYVNK